MRADDSHHMHENPVQVGMSVPTTPLPVSIRHVTEPARRLPAILVRSIPCVPTLHVNDSPLPPLPLRVRLSNWASL
jgi:hypothetical protein